MPLTLVLGPANSAKAGEVLGAYADAAHRGAVLVVPTTRDADHYRRELAAHGTVLGSVRTFAGLAFEIADRAGFVARRLTRFQRERVLKRVVAGAGFEALARSSSAPGFVTAAGRLIAELQRSLITPERFDRAMSAWAAGDERRGPYARDVSSLYSAYARELDILGRVDAELHAWRALDALRAAPGRWGGEPVLFYGFDELTALERDAVETLARVAGAEVTVSLTYEPGRRALTARAEAVEELRPLAERVLALPALDEHYEPRSRAALHHLERGLFEVEPAPGRIDPGTAVRLLEAGGERAEAELLAAEVLALLRAAVPAEEIVIVYRSLARAAPVLERVFSDYGIAVAYDRSVPFGYTALGRGVLGLARCALLDEQRARAEDLLDYLRCPGLLERPEVADRLEFECSREAVRGAAQARARLGWALEEIDSLRAADAPAPELARHARRLLAAPHRGEASLLDPGEELDARALAALLAALAELDELGERPSGDELIELLETLEVRAGTAIRPEAVLLSEPLGIRARRFRAVFVGGLQEGEFPRPGTPDPFLGDERRRELAAHAGLRLGATEDALERERYLFYACVSRATEQLVLSYRSSDEEGNLALPSPFVADVAGLLAEGWVERRRRRLLADVVWDADGAPTERERARAHASAGHDPVAGAPAEGRRPARSLGPPALARLRHLKILSGGALESYADCPVKWLVERELAPEALEPEPDPLARGNYMHAALEEVLRRLGQAVSRETLAGANRILDEVLSEIPTTLAAGRSEAVRAATLQTVEADLRRYLAYEAANGCGWRPEGIELRFGFEQEQGSLPPLVLGDGPDRILVRGVIDRIDVDPDGGGGAIVRDYKSGSSRPAHQGARWGQDRQLQVALYMLAARELLGLRPVAGLYQPLGGGDLRARGIYLDDAPVGTRVVANDARTAEELDASLAEAAERAISLAARLRLGELEPCPQTCTRDGCAYPGICRSQ
jgi:ATP-dependent helicase/DNAse subunit B